MKKVEEFNKTQMLMDEFKKLGDKGPEIDNKIDEINKNSNLSIEEINSSIERTNQTIGDAIERLEEEMKLNAEDIKFNLDTDTARASVEQEYQDRIAEARKKQETEIEKLNKQLEEIKENQKEEIEQLNKEKEEAENNRKEFFTDEKAQTITLEIKDMKKEIDSGNLEIKKLEMQIKQKELELQQKDIELQEFYDEKDHENPVRWQEIYNEKDAIKKEIEEIKGNIQGIRDNIEVFNKKIEEYTRFKEEITELKYPKITVKLDEEEKTVDPKTDPVVDPKKDPVVDPKTDPVVDPKKDPVVDPKKDPAVDPKKDPVVDPKKDPVVDSKKDPVVDSKKDPVVDPKKDPVVNPKKDPVVDPKKDSKPTGKIDLKDIKIIIGRKGLKIQAPNLDKIAGENEYEMSLKDLKYEVEDWIDYYDAEEFLDTKLTEEQLEKADPNILTALSVIRHSDVDIAIKKELMSRYAEALTKDGKVPEEKSLKGIIEYDRTGLDYLKPRNLFSRIIHKKQFDDMKHYADIAEEMGIAEIKQDEPGKIRKFFSNIKNKVPLFANKETKMLPEETKSKKYSDRVLKADGKALLEATEKYKGGYVDIDLDKKEAPEVSTGWRAKRDSFMKSVKETFIIETDEEEEERYAKEDERIERNKKLANARKHVTISDDEVVQKEDAEEAEKTTEEKPKTKKYSDRVLKADGEALLEAMDKYREGQVDIDLDSKKAPKVSTGWRAKRDSFMKGVKETFIIETDEEEEERLSNEAERIARNKELATARKHVTISDGDVMKKDDDAR